jgi:SAM-dependent methyltransferase
MLRLSPAFRTQGKPAVDQNPKISSFPGKSSKMTTSARAKSTNICCTIKGLRAVCRDVNRKVKQVGIVRTVGHCLGKALQALRSSPANGYDDSFDVVCGTDTSGIVAAGALDVPDQILEYTNRYEPVTPELLVAMLKELPISHSEFTFVDIGAGKGRALLLAARFSFSRIVGIEISASLAEAARRNIASCHDPLQICKSIQVNCQDARSYELPQTGLVVFLYNPFNHFIMQTVLTNLEESLRRNPRKVYVLYHGASHRDLWDRSKVFSAIRNTAADVIYESCQETSLSA